MKIKIKCAECGMEIAYYGVLSTNSEKLVLKAKHCQCAKKAEDEIEKLKRKLDAMVINREPNDAVNKFLSSKANKIMALKDEIKALKAEIEKLKRELNAILISRESNSADFLWKIAGFKVEIDTKDIEIEELKKQLEVSRAVNSILDADEGDTLSELCVRRGVADKAVFEHERKFHK